MLYKYARTDKTRNINMKNPSKMNRITTIPEAKELNIVENEQGVIITILDSAEDDTVIKLPNFKLKNVYKEA
jgi:hypothetical protein